MARVHKVDRAAGEWAAELESCTHHLLAALRRRSPDYVEFLERRGELLCAVPDILNEADKPRIAAAITRARMAGMVCVMEAQRMRRDAAYSLEALRQEELLASGLRALRDPQQAMLDLKG